MHNHNRRPGRKNLSSPKSLLSRKQRWFTVQCTLSPKGVSKRFDEYLALGLPTDQPVRFVEWLYKQEPVYGYMLKDYLWDIGTHEAYKACNESFSN
jgi:hypothetical protein